MEVGQALLFSQAHCPVDKGGVEVHGAGGDTVPAPDTDGFRLSGTAQLFLSQAQECVGVLYHRRVQIGLYRSGHRAARENHSRFFF